MARILQRLTVSCLLLLFFVGNAAAQSDRQFVIKKGNHYLAHVNIGGTWVLQDATDFGPDCIWYSGTDFNPSGTNHNYYFYDGANYRFLSAPLQANGTLSLSESTPSTSLLRNTDQIYYFFDWDPDAYGRGIVRGHQHTGITQESDCEYSWDEDDHQCWQAYWVEYDEGGTDTWKLTSDSHYDIPSNAARFRNVDVTVHDMEISNPIGGLGDLSNYVMDYPSNQNLSISVSNYTYTYIPAYTTYVFEGGVHNYYNNADQGTNTPGSTTSSNNTADSYNWTITGAGAEYLSFASGSDVNTSTATAPTLYYRVENTSGHQTALLTLTVTYSDGATQVRTATVTVKTQCQNPAQDAAPLVTFEDVTVSWVPTAEHYKVYWQKVGAGSWNSVEVGNVSSYTITDLEYETNYIYKVSAFCSGSELDNPQEYTFTTLAEPSLLVYGSVFGGGRMADVGGKTEVVVINCEDINAIYGGNDIAGAVRGAEGSNIILGVNSGDTYDNYGTTTAEIKIGDVYGGGNGYYAYNGSSFVAATADYTSETVASGASVRSMTQSHEVDGEVWTNTGDEAVTLNFPSITKTAITVTNDFVKVDSLFGGAKNAFLTFNDPTDNGSTITIDGGTIFAIFGGNNFGGTQGYGKHHIDVTKTNTNLTPGVTSTATTGYGRDFGIRYLFGGGNKVTGSTTEILITGGQIDTIFGGGNAADVYSANVTIDCPIAAKTNDYTFGNVYSQAISAYSEDNITVNDSYNWNGSGVYNVDALFGGNNKATMSKVPTLTLISGSIGTVYGGGNAGDMLDQATDNGSGGTLTINEDNVKYGTHVILNSANIVVDYLYGGCQMSNVDYSTWVEIQNGHVGTVYGGCNVSGDVGSTRINPDVPRNPPTEEYQAVQGGTYVVATGGTVYKNLFAGSNGFYHCNNGINYIDGINYDPQHSYIGLPVPTHNETHVLVSDSIMVKGNVYAGGNLACVGFLDVTAGDKPFPWWVGLSSIRMSGGTVKGNVFGGGNMASVYGSNEVQVTGGTIEGALYGGNDRTGQVAQFSNRVLPDRYDYASDNTTSLTDVHTYISLTGTPNINTVFGGGNGDYIYDGTGDMQYCQTDDQPIQTNTFVDINIDGGTDGGHIGTVYGGGDGVTVTGFITVFLNVDNPDDYHEDNVGTIFGGNNKGDLADLVPDIILLHGQVNTVYGGCNQGAMAGSKNLTIGDDTYTGIGSYVRLRETYQATSTSTPVDVTAVVSGAVYGGCRMNGVTNNTLVLIEGGDHSGVSIFGGSDISGTIGGTSQVVVVNGTIADAYGGGNGNYDYTSGDYAGLTPPFCTNSSIEMVGGTADNLYAGGYAGECGNTYVLMEDGTVNGNLFGGGNMAGVTNNSTVTMNGGEVLTGVYGGCNNSGDITGNVQLNINQGTIGAEGTPANIHGGGYGLATTTSGDVTVNIGVIDAASANVCPVIYGDVYGGSALGSVNNSSSDVTTVNFLNGTLHGNLYGGGLGDKADLGTGHDDVEAKVYGQVVVNIGNLLQVPENCFIDLRGCSVYGCNNTNGSPQDNVTVNVYNTAHTATDLATYRESDATFAIDQVFGGGNQADYLPEDGLATSTKTALVKVYSCDNTIRRVFGGGNAAASTGVATNIEGGRFYQIFGGGNGEVTAANIGLGGVGLTVTGGVIHQLFGGSNSTGTITGDLNVTLSNEGNCPQEIDEFFGGGNLADISGNLTTTVLCSDPFAFVHDLYGGSNMAGITGDVTLNIHGGDFDYVYGGSKGDENTSADITGNVELNIYGGAIDNAFGGCNINGNISGIITVNVNADDNCDLALLNVYGASNLATYTPTDADAISPNYSPIVNIIHGTVLGNVFGAGKGIVTDESSALVTANPQVNIQGGQVNGNVYGGGEIGSVSGTTYINVTSGSVGTVETGVHRHGNVYGGGLGIAGEPDLAHVNASNVTIGTSGGNTSDFTIYGSVFGGGENGHVNTNTLVTMHSGTVGTERASGVTDNDDIYRGNVYGGGRGVDLTASNTHSLTAGIVKGNTNVIIDGGLVRRNVYGGGSLACVGTITYDANGIPSFTNGTGTASVTISGGQIGTDGGKSACNLNVYPAERDFRLENGSVFGSGRGMAGTEYASLAYVNTTEVTINGTAYVTGSVFGGGENGHVKDHTEVTVQKTSNSTFNNSITNQSDPYPVIGYPLDANELKFDDENPKVIYRGNVYGGGRGLDYIQGQTGTYSPTAGIVLGYTEVEITGGTVYHNVYGGGSLAMTGPYITGSNTTNSGTQQPGEAYVTIKGNAVIGTKGTVQQTINGVTRDVTIGGFNNGSVYGSARGVAGTGQYAQLAYVKNTHVTIGGEANTDVPEVLGSVFGGGENGHVEENTNVSIVSGTVGTNRVTNEEPIATEIYRGNVYGGGRGVDHLSDGTLSTTAGIVEGNTNVSVTGGTVLHNVYGGGSLACVGDPNEAPQADGTYLTGLATVSVTGGQIGSDGGASAIDYSTTPSTRNHLKENGFVFGSGRGVAATDGSAYINLAYVKNTNVTVGGTSYVTGSVFGGGENGHVRLNTNVTVNANSVVGYDLVAADLVENLANPRILYRGNVYGGGRGIDPVDNAGNLSKTAGVVKGNTLVTVNGGTIRHDVYGGGSMASVGTYTYDSQGNVTDIAEGTGLASVLVQGGTIGLDTVLTVTQVTDHNLSGINNGKVFGGGRGQAGQIYKNLAYVDSTYVYIHDGFVCGSVFGGGCNGHVKRNTHVVMDGGTVGHTLTQAEKNAGEDFEHPSPIYFGNVYGGGRGIDLDGSGNISPTAGLVYGNTKVEISGGRVHHDVYGGGSLANVGTADDGGTATVNITGTAIIGTDGKNAGFVYGSGRGIAGASWSDMAFVKETFVTIGTDGGSDNPQVRGSVFGGGSNGHVTEDTQVNLYTGTIGTKLTAAEMVEADPNSTPAISRPRVYRGNVYGGGRGVERDETSALSATAGRVYGNTNVTVEGGKVYHNVYGGGSLASVGTYTIDGTGHHYTDGTGKATVTINGGEIGMSTTDAASVSGATQWHSGLNSGQVYGSGRGEAGMDFVNFAFVNETEVNIESGNVIGAVFGGGANGHVNTDTHVTVSGGTVGIDDVTSNTFNVYRGNVYGGGRGIDLDGSGNVSSTAGVVYGNTNVTVEGGTIMHNVFGGGSLASVGTATTSGGTTTFADGTGLATITISGGTIGIDASIDENNGHVFGSGRGYPHPNLVNLTYVNNTDVNILDGATIKGSVFGSGDNGQVYTEAHVTMSGGNIGTSGGNVDGNLFGSGRGVDTYTDNGNAMLNEMAGLVHGDTYVTMSGGNVKNNIYGGGYMASVTGNANVEVTGAALVGVSSNTNGGKVFGACCGVDNVSGIAFNPTFAKIHGNTIVNIHGASVNILSNVYGGGQLGAVGGNTNVTIAEATLNNVYGAGQGVESTNPVNNADVCQSTNVTMMSGTVNGSVFGGGEYGSVGIPYDPTSAPTGGSVSTVNVEGGRVLGSAFGGGNLGFNKGRTFMNLSDGAIVEQNIFGGAYGSLNTVYVAGLHTVNMRGGTVYGNVYGGSRNADDALDFNGNYLSNETGHVSVVNISGGHAVNHVFASGYFGKAYGSVFAFIGTNAIMNAPNNTFNTSDPTYNQAYYDEHTSLVIDRDVWAGADYGDYTAGQFGDPTISGKSNIYVDGLGYDTENAIPTSNSTYNENDFMIIRNSIYGSGTSCDAAHVGDREIIVRNYGKLVASSGFDPYNKTLDEPYTNTTRDLFSIQRADNLIIENSNINLIGQGLVNSFNATEKYSIHEFNTVRVVNSSSVFINKPLEQIKKLGSYTCPDVYAANPQYTVVDYSDLDPTNSDTYVKNKFRINQGTYIAVVYRTTSNGATDVRYGELEGYFFMMTEGSERAFAYARPKHSDDPDNGIGIAYDNPNDGGFVSYHIGFNTYNIDGLTVTAGIQIPYENHAPARAGELYFRVWRYSDPNVQHTLREGVLNAIVQTGAGTSPGDFYRSEAVRITLPPSAGAGSYYRIQLIGGEGCNITYGTEYIMKNAALYDDEHWMYTNCDADPDVFDYNPDPLPSDITGAQATMQSNPNNAFGLVAVPVSGLQLTENKPWIICNEAAEHVLRSQGTVWLNNTGNNLMPEIDFYLTYSNAINSNNVWDPVVIFFDQYDASGHLIDEVEVRLTITTITDISQTITTETYALMFGDATAEHTYTTKILLPPYNVQGPDFSEWTLLKAEWIPETGFSQSTIVEYSGAGYEDHTDLVAMTINPSLNFDNSNGWHNNPLNVPLIDINTVKMDGSTNPITDPIWLGETDGRNPISFNAILYFDARKQVLSTELMGKVELTLQFTNKMGATEPQELKIIIEVWRKGRGNRYYIDGIHGSVAYDGTRPNAAKPTLANILYFTNFTPGDVIYIVDKVTVTSVEEREWNGQPYNKLNFYRYDGGHELYTGTENQYGGYIDRPYLGPLIDVKGKMTISSSLLDGSYTGNPYHTSCQVKSTAPLINVSDGGELVLFGGTIYHSDLMNNYNDGTGAINAGAINIEDGGTVKINNYVYIQDNYVEDVYGGGMYLEEGGTLLLSDLVTINDNHKVERSGDITQNVYLESFNSNISVGTLDPTDVFESLNPNSKVGITKTDWDANYNYMPVLFGDDGNHLTNLHFKEIVFDDQGVYRPEVYEAADLAVANPEHHLFFVKTWATEVREEPSGFDASAIDTPEELAWAISLVNGLNGQTATPASNFNITNDIDMSANIWDVIGNIDLDDDNVYSGIFEGNGHTISGINSQLNRTNMGLFGKTENATISNLIVNTDFDGGTVINLGSIAGEMAGGYISNAEASGILLGKTATQNIGGMIGKVETGTLNSVFAANTFSGGNATIMGGLVGTNGGDLYNAYSNMALHADNAATTIGGLVGINSGHIENCYSQFQGTEPSSGFGWFARTNNGTITYCYSPAGKTQYIINGAAPTGHGNYGNVNDTKDIGYMYGDNAVTLASGATAYVHANEIEYTDNHIINWNGLLWTLNKWVKANPANLNPAPTPWFRPISTNINGDLPVLAFATGNCLGTTDGRFLRYGTTENGKNGIDALLTVFNDDGAGDAEPNAYLFLYGNATNVDNAPKSNVNVSINEDVCLMQKYATGYTQKDFIQTTVGISFDNSYKTSASDYFGNPLEYDWHFLSSPLQAAPMGMTYDPATGYDNPASINGMTGNYLPNGLVGQTTVKWDLYSFYEPQYHWINLKRASDDHWHFEEPHHQITYTNESTFVQGKGYMAAISQDSYLNNTGTLNNGNSDITVKLTKQSPTTDELGCNLLGNPYQAYLDMSKFFANSTNSSYLGSSYWVYIAEGDNYIAGNCTASNNYALPSVTLHPHQAFFVKTDTDNVDATFSYDMATADPEGFSYFRRVNYPLVNLFATNEQGKKDLTVIEVNRPVTDGSPKLRAMNNANFELYARVNSEDYSILFTEPGTERVAVCFKAKENGTYTLSWDTQNGEFEYLQLIDNITGGKYDMLSADHYSFQAKVTDMATRFYVVFRASGSGDDPDGSDDGFAFFDGNDWVVSGEGLLQLSDVAGHVLYTTYLPGEISRLQFNQFAAGVYVLQLNDRMQKIVIRR